MQLQVEYVDISTIKPYKGNAKEHPKEQIEQIKKSMQEFGNIDPIGIWHNEIVEGHGRYLALKELGETQVPVIRLDDLTDEQRRAYTLVHNQLTMNSGFDLDTLKVELDNIGEIDMSEFGFNLDGIGEEPQEVQEDEPPAEDEVQTRCKRGDLWKLGNHRLLCGDSTSAEDVARLMDGEKADMVFTDPPYGMNLDTDYSSMKSKLAIANDKDLKGSKYAQGLVDEFNPEMISMVLSLNAQETFLWGADYYAEILPNKNNGSWIVWDKRANDNNDIEQDLSSDKMFGSCFELCWSKKKHKRDIARIKWAGVFGLEKEFDHQRQHPTQKPIALVQWFLDRYSKDNQNVVDLFGGSGSTLIACEQLNRKCYTMELDEHYCDVILQRWENLTGQTAELINRE